VDPNKPEAPKSDEAKPEAGQSAPPTKKRR